MSIGRRGDVLKFKSTEKTHATLKPKKRFPMYFDHIHFLVKRAGWKVTNVHRYYTFEQDPFKKEYILGNQKARQAAVARGDYVQANLWKLLNNANFGFDCRDNWQNKSLHLIYDDVEEVDFISKYSRHVSDNCFLDLDSQLSYINRYYDNEENFDESEIQFVETIREEDVARAKERFSKKKNGKRGNNKLPGHTQHLEEAYSNKAYTFVQDLEEEGVNSVKGVACKKQLSVKLSTRYISSKLLINAKIPLASFIYDCIDTFCFANQDTQEIYNKNQLIKVFRTY